jgi:hypothetical protein
VQCAAAWNEWPIQDIIDDYEDGIFTTPYAMTREEVHPDDLDEIPYVSDDGYEIPLFSKDGFQIQRRIGLFASGSKPHGVLINLLQTRNLFTNDVDELAEEECGVIDFTVYPQAGLRNAGHFQAKGLVLGCYPLLKLINRQIARGSTDESRDVDDEDDNTGVGHAAIHVIASQGYNAMMHHTRGRTAQHHEVQVGQVTAALAGQYARTAQHVNVCKRLTWTCCQALLHEAFSAKIRGPAISTDLRLENVYYIDMKALRPQQRNGRY